MNITNKKLNEIKPYEKNPRNNKKAINYVANSIQEFGFKQPIVIDKEGVIIAGHTRYQASKKLKIKEVPCIIADDLTPEQVKAYRLADNKVSELAEWDIDLLDGELADISNIDMQDFGFEFSLDEPQTPKEPEEKHNERERTFDAYNLADVDNLKLSDKWQMPIIKRCNHIPKDLLSFNYAKSSTEYDKGIHFYIDDYQFERIWNNPHEYMDILKQYDCVLTPDFSLYTEMPLPMQMWNVYRSKMIGQIMQSYGIKVIPTLQWCMPNTFDFAFDGIEKGGTVSVSTIGVKRDKNASKIWFDGMSEAIKQLRPKNIIIYGGDIGFDFREINTVYINNHNTERMTETKQD